MYGEQSAASRAWVCAVQRVRATDWAWEANPMYRQYASRTSSKRSARDGGAFRSSEDVSDSAWGTSTASSSSSSSAVSGIGEPSAMYLIATSALRHCESPN